MSLPQANQSSFGSSSDDEAMTNVPIDEAGEWEIVDFDAISNKDARRTKKPALAFSWRFQFSLEFSRETSSSMEPESGEKKTHRKRATGQLHDDPTTSQQQQCRFFALPPELRLQIYKHILSCPSSQAVAITWTLSTDNLQQQQQRRRPWTVLAILQTCRRMYAEAETIFYAVNQLHLASVDVARGFLHAISAERLGAIRSLSFSAVSSSSVLTFAQVIADAPALQTVQIHREQSIRYIDVKSWAVLATQITAELSKLRGLRRLDFITPDVTAPTPVEVERMESLRQVDRRIVEAVGTPVSI